MEVLSGREMECECWNAETLVKDFIFGRMINEMIEESNGVGRDDE